ncbi:hypothetical protein EDB85DRAFT_2152218 [Lactarius pseudohatsudake]|nr:hypothetical protein EDB85DRAFT_2152218 [Lactarius pseudohatsudake]
MAHAATGRPRHHRPAVLPISHVRRRGPCVAPVLRSLPVAGLVPVISEVLTRAALEPVRDAFAEAGFLIPTIATCSWYSTTLRPPPRGLALRSVAIHIISWLCPQLHSTLLDTNCRFLFIASGAPLGVPFSFVEFPPHLTALILARGQWASRRYARWGRRMVQASVRLAG